MNVKEIAIYFSVHPGSVRRWAVQGCPHTYTHRGRQKLLCFDIDAVKAWLKGDK